MDEVLKNTNILNLDEEQSKQYLESLLKLDSDIMQEKILEIIDDNSNKFDSKDDDSLPLSHSIIFTNDKIKKILEDLYDKFDTEL